MSARMSETTLWNALKVISQKKAHGGVDGAVVQNAVGHFKKLYPDIFKKTDPTDYVLITRSTEAPNKGLLEANLRLANPPINQEFYTVSRGDSNAVFALIEQIAKRVQEATAAATARVSKPKAKVPPSAGRTGKAAAAGIRLSA